MKHLLYILPSLVFSQIKEDKIAHFAWGTAAGVPTYYIYTENLNFNQWEGIALTTATGALVGWGFEHLQKSKGTGVYDNGDWIAGATGALTGAIFARLMRGKPDTRKERQLRKIREYEERLQKID